MCWFIISAGFTYIVGGSDMTLKNYEYIRNSTKRHRIRTLCYKTKICNAINRLSKFIKSSSPQTINGEK